jgi:hypothetical protein
MDDVDKLPSFDAGEAPRRSTSSLESLDLFRNNQRGNPGRARAAASGNRFAPRPSDSVGLSTAAGSRCADDVGFSVDRDGVVPD